MVLEKERTTQWKGKKNKGNEQTTGRQFEIHCTSCPTTRLAVSAVSGPEGRGGNSVMFTSSRDTLVSANSALRTACVACFVVCVCFRPFVCVCVCVCVHMFWCAQVCPLLSRDSFSSAIAIKRPRTRSAAARQVSNAHERDLVTNKNVWFKPF